MKHLTTLKRAEVVVLYHQNIPFKEIARRLMISRNTVKLWVRRYVESGDIERRRPGPNPVTYTDASDRHRDIVARHNSDPSLATRETAAIHDVSLCTVRRHLKASNIHFNREISRRLMISRTTVRLWVRRYEESRNIERRKPGPATMTNADDIVARHRHGSNPPLPTRSPGTTLDLKANNLNRNGWKEGRTHKKTLKRTEGTSESLPETASSSQMVGTLTQPLNSAAHNTDHEDTYEAFPEPPAGSSSPSQIVFEVPTLIKEKVKKIKPKRKKGTGNLLRCGMCLKTIDGTRILCLQCPGSVVCGSCERHGKLHEAHTVLRIPSTEAFEKLKHLIEKIQLDVAAALAGRPREPRHVAKQEGGAPAVVASTTTQPKLRTYTNTKKDVAASLLVCNNSSTPAANAVLKKAKLVEHRSSRTFLGHKRPVVENKKEQTKRTKERKESIDKDGDVEPLIYNPDEDLFATIKPEPDPLLGEVDRTKKRKTSNDKNLSVQPLIYPEESLIVTIKSEPDPLFGVEDDLPLKRAAPDLASSPRGDGSSGDPVGASAVEVKDEPQ